MSQRKPPRFSRLPFDMAPLVLDSSLSVSVSLIPSPLRPLPSLSPSPLSSPSSLLLSSFFSRFLVFSSSSPLFFLLSPPFLFLVTSLRRFSHTPQRTVLPLSEARLHSGRGVSAVRQTFFLTRTFPNTDLIGGLLHSGRGVPTGLTGPDVGAPRNRFFPIHRTGRHRGTHARPRVYTLDEGCLSDSSD